MRVTADSQQATGARPSAEWTGNIACPTKTLLAMLACAAMGFGQPASVEGTAVNSLDGQALSGVHISLIGLSPTGIRDAYGAMSDPHGHFSIAGVPPGMYILFTEKRGFLYVQKKKSGIPLPSIGLKAGERKADFKLEMTPRAVISGRVVDEAGDPVENAQVRTQPVSKEDEPIAITFGEDVASTDDHGVFRISGPPGKFYVSANSNRRGDRDESTEIRLDGSANVRYGRTLYPSAATEEQAATVEAKAGTEVNGIEIRLIGRAPRVAPSLGVSGVVQGIPAGASGPREHTRVWIAHGSTAEEMGNQNEQGIEDDGSFKFRNLEPGFYRIWASYGNGTIQLQSQPMELRLEGGDVSNLQLNLGPGGDLNGTIEIAGEQPGSPKQKRTVRVGGSEGETDRNGAFRLNGIMPGKYGVGIDPMPENGYVKALTLDGTAIAGNRVDFSHGVHGSKLKVVIATGGEITGTVVDKDGQKVLNSVTAVFLVPAEGDAEQNGHNMDMDQVDDDAAYSLHGILPGKYYLVGYDLFASGLDFGNRDKMKKIAKEHGELVEVKEGDRIKKNATVFEEQGDGKK